MAQFVLKAEIERRIAAGGFAAARRAVAVDAIRSPLLPFECSDGRELRMKAECLQPYGSFKIRAAANVLADHSLEALQNGVACPSAGNFGQGLAYACSRRGIELTVHAPDNAADVKLSAMRRLGAKVLVHPFPEWWRIMSTRETGFSDGLFVHPVCEPGVIIGNGTIGLELVEDWPDVDTIVVPFGGGGLISGVALAIKSLGHPARIVAVEVETAAPLGAAMKAGEPVTVPRSPSFVDGIGSTRVLDEMWPLLNELVDHVVTVSLDAAANGVRVAAQASHLLIEGAAGAALAAALSREGPGQRVAVILSGGNIDARELCRILAS